MLRPALLAALVALPVLSATPARAGAGASSAPCTAADDVLQTWENAAHAISGSVALGQSLTAPCDGYLRAVSFTVAALPTPGALAFTLFQGAGQGGAVAAQTTVDVAAPGVYTVTLAEPVPVTTGAVYTFRLTVPAGGATSATLSTWYGGGNGLRYPGGVEYSGSGGGFGPLSQFDLTFGADFAAAAAGCPIAQLASDGAVDLNTAFNPALGQSFRPTCSGVLRALSFSVSFVGDAGPLAVTVYAGSGDGGAVLARDTVVVQAAGLQTVALAHPVPVTAGAAYTFKLTIPAGQSTMVDLEDHVGNPYAGGSEYNVAYAGGGSAFAAATGWDLAFTADVAGAPLTAVPPSPTAGALALGDPAPHPARGRALLPLTVAEARPVTVAVYDALGRRVAVLHDGPLAAGAHALAFDAAALPAGVYVVRAVAGEATAVRRVTVAR